MSAAGEEEGDEFHGERIRGKASQGKSLAACLTDMSLERPGNQDPDEPLFL